MVLHRVRGLQGGEPFEQDGGSTVDPDARSANIVDQFGGGCHGEPSGDTGRRAVSREGGTAIPEIDNMP